jgi:hypothetical protein
VKNEMKRIWKEAVVAQFKVPSWHVWKDCGKSQKTSQDNRSPGRDLKEGPPECKPLGSNGRQQSYYLHIVLLGSVHYKIYQSTGCK